MKKHFVAVLSLLAILSPMAGAQSFIHPGIPLTRQDLDFLKQHLDEDPWKAGYAALKNERFAQLSYRQRGPWEVVERYPGRPKRNTEWKQDMWAINDLALMWYFTGDEAYARKAHDLLLAWATVHKRFDGWEGMLDLGEQVYMFAGGADILRGTWPGWTADDTAKVKQYFRNVLLPATCVQCRWIGPANKGALALVAATGIAVFLDDRALFNECLDLLQTHIPSALAGTLSTGQATEAGRDLGHNFGQVNSLVLAAEIAWKQGVDLYSDLDNRLLACGEYYCCHASGNKPPFITLGTTDALYWGPCAPGWPHGRRCFNMLITAYRFRKGMPTPWLDLWSKQAPVGPTDFCHYLPEDHSTAIPRLFRFPSLDSVSRGLALKDIGNAMPTGCLSYTSSKGVWTMTAGGEEIWRHGGDSFSFACKRVQGNFTIIARVDSIKGPVGNCKAALMVRENLDPNGTKAWVAAIPDKSAEWFMSGWTSVRGGQNWEKGARKFPDDYPVWLKLQRIGDMIYQCWSPDGTSWSSIGAGSFGNLGRDTYVGLAVCSLKNGSVATAEFSRVTMTGGDGLAVIPKPDAPKALLASPGAGGVPLRWSQSFAAARYDVKRSASPEGPFVVIGSVQKPSFMDTALLPGVTHYYTVSAINSGGESFNSPVATAAGPVVGSERRRP